MAKHTRNPWPRKIVWLQSNVTHARYYWLAVPAAEAKGKRKLVAEVQGQTFRLTGDVPKGATLRLSDLLVDLDQPVVVVVNEKEVFRGKAPRSLETIRQSLQERADPRSAACATVILDAP